MFEEWFLLWTPLSPPIPSQILVSQFFANHQLIPECFDLQVGFYPRAISCTESGDLIYQTSMHTKALGYHLVLAKAALFHRDFLTAYWESGPNQPVNTVDVRSIYVSIDMINDIDSDPLVLFLFFLLLFLTSIGHPSSSLAHSCSSGWKVSMCRISFLIYCSPPH